MKQNQNITGENWKEEPLSEDELYQFITKKIMDSLRTGDPYSRQKTFQEFSRILDKPKEEQKYTQDWQSYNKAQQGEKVLLIEMLNDLLIYIDFPAIKKKVGRNPIPTREKIFYLVMQAYNQKSTRRCISDLELCRKLNYIEKKPHFNTISKILKEQEITNYLKHLIQISGLPLQQVELDFAVDSTGFSTYQYGRWFDTRLRDFSDKKKFRKCHATCGVKTNIITAVNITQGYEADSPQFGDLVHQTNRIYNIREVSADKAYSSRNNLQIVSDIGAKAFIPFKKNVTGNQKGNQIWGQMYRYYSYHRVEFLEHYHKRSNSETVFHMLKMKFGSTLRTKNEISQTNEILAKCLAHNLCVLIQERFEIGIDVNFEKCAEIPIAHK